MSQPPIPPSPNQPSSQTPPPNPPESQEVLSLRREKAALSAMLWELVRQAAPDTHSVEVFPAASDPLWQLAFVQSSDAKSGKVQILAGTIKPIAEQEKKRVVRLLRGTSTPMQTALAQLELDRFPPSYVEKEIAKHLAWRPVDKDAVNPHGVPGHWESVSTPSIGETAKNIVGWPK